MAARKRTNPIKPFDDFWIGEPNSGCWLWTGYVHKTGYGSYTLKGKTRLAHRFSYEMYVGDIPEGHDLDHLCRVRCCVNPDHLEPVSRRENLERSPIWSGNFTHCPSGHAYDEGNTYYYNGSRRCMACRRTHQLNYTQRKREAA